MVRSIFNILSLLVSGVVDSNAGNSRHYKLLVADFISSHWLRVSVYGEIFHGHMHKESKREMDIEGAGGKEHDLDKYDEENGDSNAFKEIFSDKERDEADESHVLCEKWRNEDL